MQRAFTYLMNIKIKEVFPSRWNPLKLKGGLGKIGYLKKAIPHRTKKKEETESEKLETE